MDISRFQNMKELRMTIEFLTPTFLGGADGNAELRTAPFKNLLRRWWRITRGELSQEELWKKEAELFGSVTGKKAGASKIRLVIRESTRYSDVKPDIGLTKGHIFGEESTCYSHVKPKIGITGSGRSTFDKAIYLGYGPISAEETKEYITHGSKFILSIYVPEEKKEEIETVLAYIHYFGTIGSRSRNGWGSLAIIPENFNIIPLSKIIENSTEWKTGFKKIEQKKYPFYLGTDKKGLLCWETKEAFSSFEEAMSILADIYKDLRFEFKPKGNKESDLRPLLGYPITGITVDKWEERMPSQIILKVKGYENKYKGIILHIPHKIPFNWDSEQMKKKQVEVWQKVHESLDCRKEQLHRLEVKK